VKQRDDEMDFGKSGPRYPAFGNDYRRGVVELIRSKATTYIKRTIHFEKIKRSLLFII
jgi:hypothetical protein